MNHLKYLQSLLPLVLAVAPVSFVIAGVLDNAESASGTSVAIGADARADASDSVAIGSNSFTFEPFSVSVGATSNANSLQTTAIGAAALADQPQATAVGSFAQAFGQFATAVGGNAVVEGQGASAFGTNTVVEAAGATALGYQSAVVEGASNAVALGSHSVATQVNTVSVGDADSGLTRRITNVAAAVFDNDAVNLYQFNQGVGAVRSDAFAGIAAAAAFNQAYPSAPGKTAVSLGAASYRGEQAMAVSFSRRLSESTYNTSVNGGVAYDTRNHALGKVGVSWEF